MGHHAKEDDREMIEALRKMVPDSLKEQFERQLGPTGKFPEGKITSSDEGEIRMAVGTKDGKVVINFGSKVVWVGMNPTQARDLSDSLRHWANQAEGV